MRDTPGAESFGDEAWEREAARCREEGLDEPDREEWMRESAEAAGRNVLDDDALERHVRLGTGISGHCTDYVMSTLAHLREMKIHDPALERLASRLGTQAASKSS